MFKNELVTREYDGLKVVHNRYSKPKFWKAYGYTLANHSIMRYGECGQHATFFDTYRRYKNTAEGRVYQSIVITFSKRRGEPMIVTGFRIDAYNVENGKTIVAYDSYQL